ncbi:MAG: ATP-dependent zinc metalloprotease FtsH [Acidimicrobiales bacterium]
MKEISTSSAGRWASNVHQTNSARGGPPRDPPPPPPPPAPPRWRPWLLILGAAITVLFLWAITSHPATHTVKHFSYSQLLGQVKGNHVTSATITPKGQVQGVLKGGQHYVSQIPLALQDKSLGPLLTSHHVKITATGPRTSGWSILASFLPFIFFIALFVWLGRAGKKAMSGKGGGGLFGGMGGPGGLGQIGAHKAKVYDAEKPSTRFSDVAGYDGAKQEITEVVEFLRHPEIYARAGAVGPRGVLMVGPPGTGKTLLARAVAGEAGVPFFAITGSSFVEMFVGVGAKRARDLFDKARKQSPSIIFIDEIDAIGGKRGMSLNTNDEREQTLNQLLAEMDGFDPSTGVVVMGATNRPESLDPALLRPGRFDRQVAITLPNQAERAAILAVHAKDKHLAPDVDLTVTARGTPGFSGADLANLLNEAAIVAVRNGRQVVEAGDLDEARDRVLIGRRDATNAPLPEEKRSVAIHEGGHALVAALCLHADPVAKVTILPAGQALGVTEQLPMDERHLYPESYLYDSLNVRLGGRAAETLVLGEGSTGAANDLAGATELATKMVREFGMSPALGPVGYSEGGPNYLGNPMASRPYAEATQRQVDEEVSRLVREAEERATALLADHRDALSRLVDILLEHETVDGSEVYAVLGRPNRLEPARAGTPHPAPPVSAPGPAQPQRHPEPTRADLDPAPVAAGREHEPQREPEPQGEPEPEDERGSLVPGHAASDQAPPPA